MVDDLAEKVDECPLSRGRYVLVVYNWEHKKCLLYEVEGCACIKHPAISVHFGNAT